MKEQQDMNKTYIISLETLKTMGKGALGAMTFGAFTQFNNNKIMELNNKYFDDKIKKLEEENKEIKNENKEIKNENKEIKEQLNQRRWFF